MPARRRALHLAAWKGRIRTVTLLVERVPGSLYRYNRDGRAPVDLAAASGRAMTVAFLMAAARERPASARVLHEAAAFGRARAVRLLLDGGIDPDARDDRGRTALHWACQEGHERVVRQLLAASVDADAHVDDALEGPGTALYIAAGGGHLPVVRALLRAGADPETPTDEGRRALHIAAQYDHPAVVAELLSDGADPRATDAAGFTPLDYARQRRCHRVIHLLSRHLGGVCARPTRLVRERARSERPPRRSHPNRRRPRRHLRRRNA